MGLMSSISKITNFIGGAATKVTALTKGSATGTNIPTNSVMRALGMGDSLGFGSLSEIKNSIESVVGGVVTGVNMIKCAYDLFSIDDAIAFLDNMANTFVNGVVGAAVGVVNTAINAATAVVDQVVGAVVGQVTAAISQVLGAIHGVLDAIQNMINSILLIADALKDLWDSWTNWADWKWSLDIESQSCEDMFTSIAGCLMNQFLGSKFDKLLGKVTGKISGFGDKIGDSITDFGDKITGKVNKLGNAVNSSIYEELSDVNAFSSYANQESFLLKKASLQIRGLTKENLLGM